MNSPFLSSLRTGSPRGSRLSLLLGVLAIGNIHPITIYDESPEVNYRFSSGFRTAQPVQNTSPFFLGAGYDLSPIGWWNKPGDAQRVKHTTLVAPLFSANATHYPFFAGDTVEFLSTSGTLVTNQVATSLPGSGDGSFTRYTRAFTAADNVSIMRILDGSGNYIGMPVLVAGSQGNARPGGVNIGTEFATARVQWAFGNGSAMFSNHSADPELTFLALQSGDSGGPVLLPYNGQLTLFSTITSASAAGVSYIPTDITPTLNAVLSPYGYALRFTIHDNPADTVNTANVWTGGAGSGIFNQTGNWTKGTAPANLPAVFDAGANGGQSTVEFTSNQSVRGLLFRANNDPEGFIFAGSGTLMVGSTGIRNEDSKTQTFNVNIGLSGSQNWEAADGDLVFNGNIHTNGNLVVIQGAHDTTVNGIISGAGSLAKDEAGTLTLNAVNTYAGTTFIHSGTIRLGANGNLGQGTVIFDADNPAVLDLNGRHQTVSNLISGYGGKGRVLLGGAQLTVNGNVPGSNTYLGSIEGEGSVIKTGSGVWTLAGNNSYSGPTRVNGGVLRLGSEQALSAQSYLVLNGGVLELAAGDFTRSLGTGEGQVQMLGSAGFSAYGADRIVNLGGAGATLTVGAGGFLPAGSQFLFSSSTANATVIFQNGINLNSGFPSFTVADGAAAVDARITGVISNGYLLKQGDGVLELTAANTYTGQTYLNYGGLMISSANALGTGNLVFNGGRGILLLAHDDLTRSLGSGVNQVRFSTGGGFAAYGADRIVNLGGAGATVTWGSGNFVPTGQTLHLGMDGVSNATVDFVNGINFGGAARTISAGNGSAAIDARLSGVLSNGGLIKVGAGTLELTGTNTYTGQTQINGGGLLISSAQALGSGNLSFNGGVLVLGAGDFTRSVGTGAGQVQFAGSGGFAAYGADRSVNLGGAGATLTWGSAQFVQAGNALLLGSDSSNAAVNFVNGINLAGGLRTFNVMDGSASVDARLLGGLSNGGIVKEGAGLLDLAAANAYTQATTLNAGVVRLSHVNALSAASSLVFGGGVLELGAGDFVRSLGTGAGQVQFVAGGGFSAVGDERTVNFGGNGSTVVWGVAGTGINGRLILSSETSDSTITIANIINLGTGGLGIRDLEVRNGSAAIDARISGTISSGGSGWGLRKLGAGTLELAATAAHTGETIVSAGTLIVGAQSALTATEAVSVSAGAIFDYRSVTSSLTRQVNVTGGTFLYNSQQAFSGTLRFDAGTLGGNGNLGMTALTVGAGQTIAPGASVGRLSTGSQTWQTGGTYLWEIDDLSGTAGGPSGWDLLDVQGDLTILSSTGGFTLQLSASETLSGWNPQNEYAWTIAMDSGAITGFSASAFTIDASAFSAHHDLGEGSFHLRAEGGKLDLVFSPVPEPTSAGLVALFLLSVASRRRRGGV
jgi:autotransporter-associated beta strand protein